MSAERRAEQEGITRRRSRLETEQSFESVSNLAKRPLGNREEIENYGSNEISTSFVLF